MLSINRGRSLRILFDSIFIVKLYTVQLWFPLVGHSAAHGGTIIWRWRHGRSFNIIVFIRRRLQDFPYCSECWGIQWGVPSKKEASDLTKDNTNHIRKRQTSNAIINDLKEDQNILIDCFSGWHFIETKKKCRLSKGKSTKYVAKYIFALNVAECWGEVEWHYRRGCTQAVKTTLIFAFFKDLFLFFKNCKLYVCHILVYVWFWVCNFNCI